MPAGVDYRAFARAVAMVDAAPLSSRADCLEAERVAQAGRGPTIEEKPRFKRSVAYAMVRCALLASPMDRPPPPSTPVDANPTADVCA